MTTAADSSAEDRRAGTRHRVAAPVRVRDARPADYPGLGALTVAAYTADGPLASGDDYVRSLADPAGRTRGCELLVAVDDAGATVGGVSLVHTGSPQQEVAGPGECEIRMLAVVPAAQGRGVAGALVAETLCRAEAGGYAAMALCVIAGNDRAHRLYRRFGFTRTPERDWAPAPGVDLLAYRRRLPGDEPGSAGPGTGSPGT